jgi:hypothetical protein
VIESITCASMTFRTPLPSAPTSQIAREVPRLDTNPMVDESGDHVGRSSTASPVVNSRASVPSSRDVQMCRLPLRVELNARRSPRGATTGSRSPVEPCVNSVVADAVPSAIDSRFSDRRS